MKAAITIVLGLLALPYSGAGQHKGHGRDTVPRHGEGHRQDTVPQQHHNMHMGHGHDAMQHQGHDMEMTMTHSYSRNLPMSRNGSGTSWVPDASPMYMYMKMAGKTTFMFHGSVFLRYTAQDVTNRGNRGGYKWDAPNWVMGMMNTPVGRRGLLNVSLMMSLDRVVMGGAGYPLLFQSGESWEGKPLVDRQHPHDLFSGLSVGYTHMISKDMDVYAYLGYPGEPALSAPAFMHRVSAMNNPDAPLGHHWQDATHITFGVGTLGFRYRKVKVEGSVFTGREPDENRYDFDRPLFDSYAYRLSYNPSANWALQFSQGFVHSPEALEPEENVVRTTASVMHVRQLRHPGSFIATTGVWGLNSLDNGHREHAALLESNLQLNRNALYGRYEYVQKSTHELNLEDELGDAAFSVHALTLGYSRILAEVYNTMLQAGLQGTANFTESALRPVYGKNPLSLEVYLRISPGWHRQ